MLNGGRVHARTNAHVALTIDVGTTKLGGGLQTHFDNQTQLPAQSQLKLTGYASSGYKNAGRQAFVLCTKPS
jgi:hypothetical protein